MPDLRRVDRLKALFGREMDFLRRCRKGRTGRQEEKR